MPLEHFESCPSSLSVWYFYLELHNWEVMLCTGQSGSELYWNGRLLVAFGNSLMLSATESTGEVVSGGNSWLCL